MKRFATMSWSDAFQLSGIIGIMLLAVLALVAPGAWVQGISEVVLPVSLVVFLVGFSVATGVMRFSPFPKQSNNPAEEAFPQSTHREVFLLHQELNNPEFMTWCKRGYRTDI
jgi:hypothetical protein